MTTNVQLIKHGLVTAFRNKKMWFIGIFVAIIGVAGEIELLFRYPNLENRSLVGEFFATLKASGIFTVEGIKNTVRVMMTSPLDFAQAMFIFLIYLALGLFIVWLVTICHGALIHFSSQNNVKKTPLSTHLKVGIKKFWPIIILLLCMKIILGSIFFVLRTLSSGVSPLTLWILAIISFLIIFFVFLVSKFIGLAIVIENLNFQRGYSRGTRLLSRHFLQSISLSFLLLVTNIVIGIVVFTLAFVVISPLYAMIEKTIALQSAKGFFVNVYFSSFLVLGLIMLLGSILSILHWSAWAKRYLELKNKDRDT